MGEYGRINRYKPAYLNNEIRNHAFLSFTLNNIQSPVADFKGTQDLLEQYIGALDYRICKTWAEVFNPFRWLVRVIRFILVDGLLWIFKSVGLIGDNASSKVSNHILTGKFIGMITLLGTLVSIISSWDELVIFVNRIFGWFPSLSGN